jgi:alpha-tubulin suppressor-like RCC1 family protein
MRNALLLTFLLTSACALDRSAILGDAGERADTGPPIVERDGGSRYGGPRDAGTVDAFVPDDAGAPVPVTALAAGVDFTCALRTDGVVRCWGDNREGQLGNGSMTSTPWPVSVALPSGSVATAIAAGDAHACAILQTGELYCWGDNSAGQVGSDAATVMTPLRITVAVSAVALGKAHSCLINADAQVLCWGSNSEGQLGTTDSGHSAPAALATAFTAESLSLGRSHTCAITDGGGQCWGRNAEGQLGDGSIMGSSVPSPVLDLTGVVRIGAGALHTCALHDAGLSCWGKGNNGRLGDGMTSGSSMPRDVDLEDVQWVDGGAEHTCALQSDGRVWCWGRDNHDQLGPMASSDAHSPLGVPMPVDDPVQALAVGGAHNCVIIDGAVYCWGNDNNGQLGPEVTSSSATPVLVPRI